MGCMLQGRCGVDFFGVFRKGNPQDLLCPYDCKTLGTLASVENYFRVSIF